MAGTSGTSIWDRVDTWQARSVDTGSGRRRFRWVVDAVLPLALVVMAGVAVLLPATLPSEARASLFGFAVAVILWSTSGINAAYVALAAVMLTILLARRRPAGRALRRASLGRSLADDRGLRPRRGDARHRPRRAPDRVRG